jgi:hypothetical protein
VNVTLDGDPPFAVPVNTSAFTQLGTTKTKAISRHFKAKILPFFMFFPFFGIPHHWIQTTATNH